MSVTWVRDEQNKYSSSSGYDEEGNRYFQHACSSIIICTLVDGRIGVGFYENKAKENAESKELMK